MGDPLKRTLAGLITALIAITGLTAVPAQALSLPYGCETTYGYESNPSDVYELTCGSGYNGGGDLSKLTNLANLNIKYMEGGKFSSLPKMPKSIEDLRLGNFTGTDWTAVYNLPNLTSLASEKSVNTPDLTRLATGSPQINYLSFGPQKWTDLSKVKAFKQLATFQFHVTHPGISATGLVKKAVLPKANTNVDGKSLQLTEYIPEGKKTSAGAVFEKVGDYTLDFQGDERAARAAIPSVRDWMVSETRTVRIKSDVELKGLKTSEIGMITGSNKVGSTLWFESLYAEPEAYQWYRNGKAISGATKDSYKQTDSDIGKRLSVKITDTRSYYPDWKGTSWDNKFFFPASATVKAPKNTVGVMAKAQTPAISGTKKVNSTVKANPRFNLTGAAVKYQWKANGKNIKGATKRTYKLRTADYGKKISVTAVATKANYVSVTKTSSSFKPSARPVPIKGAPKITGTLKGGKTLKASAGKWGAKGPKLNYKWYVDGQHWGSGPKFKVPSSDEKQRITVKVWAQKDGYTKSKANSSKTVTAKPNKKKLPVKDPVCRWKSWWEGKVLYSEYKCTY